jgi:hypothetical protein
VTSGGAEGGEVTARGCDGVEGGSAARSEKDDGRGADRRPAAVQWN